MKTKKIIVLSTIVAILTLLVTGCLPQNYDNVTFDFFGSDFSWDFSIDDAKEYIESHQIIEAEIEIERNSDETFVEDGMYTFRFNDDDKLEWVSYYMGEDSGCLYTIKDWYGDYASVDDVNEFVTRYDWYGKMAGKNTNMYLEDCSPNCYLRFELDE